MAQICQLASTKAHTRNTKEPGTIALTGEGGNHAIALLNRSRTLIET